MDKEFSELAVEVIHKICLGGSADEKVLSKVREVCAGSKKIINLAERYAKTSSYNTAITIFREFLKTVEEESQNRLESKIGDRTCSSCLEPKGLESFSNSDKDMPVCKDCMKKSMNRFSDYISNQMGGIK
jgi:hypothetical protein